MFSTSVAAHRGAFFRVLQTIVVLEGKMLARVWDGIHAREVEGGPGFALVVPAGTKHWVKSVGQVSLFLVTTHAPPAYPPHADE